MSKLSLLAETVGRSGHGLLAAAKERSPEALLVAGLVGVVTAGVLAVKASKNQAPVMENYRERMAVVDSIKACPVEDLTDELKAMTEREREALLVNESVKAKISLAADLAKVYMIPALIGAGSIACIVGGHWILRNRVKVLRVAFSGLSAAYSQYRKRVAAEVGEEKEQELATGEPVIKVNAEQQETSVLAENNALVISPYARFFNRDNVHWSKNQEDNLRFLEIRQKWANDRLRSRGFVFLNEIYHSLGFDETANGQLVGWWWRGEGDNMIDFGIRKHVKMADGRIEYLVLDFNVDGVVYDKLGNANVY